MRFHLNENNNPIKEQAKKWKIKLNRLPSQNSLIISLCKLGKKNEFIFLKKLI